MVTPQQLNGGNPVYPASVAPDKSTEDSSAFDAGTKMSVRPIGSSGTEINGGYFSEEYLQILRGHRGAKIWDEMRRSEPQVAMLLNAIMNPIKSASWEVEAAKDVAGGEDHKTLVEACLKDMIDWEAFLHEALSVIPFGFSVFEPIHNVVFDHPTLGTVNGLKALAFRGQKTIYAWNLEKQTGKLLSLEQFTYSDVGVNATIPGEFLLVFSHQKEGDNYEGISALRPMYGPYFRKNLYHKLAAIGIERYAIGMVVGTIPKGKDEDTVEVANFKKILGSFTSHESSYIMKPEGWDVEIIKGEFDATEIKEMITLENTEMINAVVANFLALGTNGSGGAYALGSDLSDFFLGGIQSYANLICGVLNRQLMPNLVKLNYGPQAAYPQIKCTGINDKAGKEFADILKSMIDSGSVKADDKLEGYLRKLYKLPEADPATARTPKPAAAPFGNPNLSEAIQLGGPGSGRKPGGKNKADNKKGETVRAVRNPLHAGDILTSKGISHDDISVTPKIGGGELFEFKNKGSVVAVYDSKSKELDILKLSEERRIQLADTYRKDFNASKTEVKNLMQDGLTTMLEAMKKDIARQWKKATPSSRVSIASKIEPKGLPAYKVDLKELLAEIANDALDSAKKDVPKAKNVKLAESIQLAAPRGGYYQALPPKIQKLVNTQTNLIAETQAADLTKVVSFQFASSATGTEDIDQILSDIDEAALPVIEGSTKTGMSVDAAASNAVASTQNQARLEFFFEPEVLDEIESFTFTNEDPVSPICQALDGTTWAANDPQVDKYSPPLHHNCKSRLVPNLKGDAGNPEMDRGDVPLTQAEIDSMTLCEPDYSLGDSTSKCVADWIPELIAKGHSQEQAIAIAYSKCGEKQMTEYFAALLRKHGAK